MNCEKLFYNDSFATTFTAEVCDCFPNKDHFAIVLDKTLFYPEGGGQPCDHGVITFGETKAEIFDVREKNGIICHYSRTEIPVGTVVEGEIDFERRFDLMQQHTGEHILSGIIWQLYGYANVGFHLSDKDMSIDLSGPLSQEDIDRCVDMANEIIIKNQPVTADYPDISKLEYRSKKALEGPVRIVTAGDADVCACCGTHLKTTGQAQMIVATDSMNYKGGTRIFFACGKRAFADYMAKNGHCLDISHLLSAKTCEITDKVKDKIAECENLKAQLAEAKNQLFSYWAETVPAGDVGFMAKDSLSSGEIQRLCSKLNEKCPTACVVSKQEDGTSKICLFSSVCDTNKVGRAICTALGGKGGGKPGIFQGTFSLEGDVESLLKGALND
ncbi:MAG: alanyl-tRNA editing protein [Ruminococcaceae bacterium]|nr:alanyl-tRNA editing protein [Oscillospiraceae bacterium]